MTNNTRHTAKKQNHKKSRRGAKKGGSSTGHASAKTQTDPRGVGTSGELLYKEDVDGKWTNRMLGIVEHEAAGAYYTYTRDNGALVLVPVNKQSEGASNGQTIWVQDRCRPLAYANPEVAQVGLGPVTELLFTPTEAVALGYDGGHYIREVRDCGEPVLHLWTIPQFMELSGNSGHLVVVDMS